MSVQEWTRSIEPPMMEDPEQDEAKFPKDAGMERRAITVSNDAKDDKTRQDRRSMLYTPSVIDSEASTQVMQHNLSRLQTKWRQSRQQRRRVHEKNGPECQHSHARLKPSALQLAPPPPSPFFRSNPNSSGITPPSPSKLALVPPRHAYQRNVSTTATIENDLSERASMIRPTIVRSSDTTRRRAAPLISLASDDQESLQVRREMSTVDVDVSQHDDSNSDVDNAEKQDECNSRPDSVTSSSSSTALSDDRYAASAEAKVVPTDEFAFDLDNDDEASEQNVSLDTTALEARVQEIVWEEEATPDETAFGKELLFRRAIHNHDGRQSSNVSSTASEMGTVIDCDCTNSRLAELDDMIPREEPAQYSAPVWDRAEDDDDGAKDDIDHALDVPKLSRQSTCASPGVAVYEEKKGDDDDGEHQHHFSPVKEDVDANMRLSISRVIRRLGSGLGQHSGGGGSGDGVASIHTHRPSASAPNTPRDSAQAVPATAGTTRVLQRSWSRDSFMASLPSTLALRSSPPDINDNDAQTRRPASSPKLGLRPTTVGAREHGIPENSELSEHASSFLSNRTIVTSAAAAGNNPFAMARSCFSFDAFDTSMDDQVEFRVCDMTQDELLAAQAHGHEWVLPLPDGSKQRSERSSLRPQVRESLSWDISGVSQGSAFRPAPFRPTLLSKSSSQSTPRRMNGSPSKQLSRQRILSETYSPPSNGVELKTPQRVEMDREDAIDILRCLVDRGVSGNDLYTNETDFAEMGKEKGSHDFQIALKAVRSLCEQNTDNASDYGAFLAVLLKSHEYAVEMKRASQSASSWLQSIERLCVEKDVVTRENSSAQTPTSAAESALRAQLNISQRELQEKARLVDRMNEELAKCRAEIGRLTSAAQADRFKSPNRSILDESLDASEAEDDGDEQDLAASDVHSEKESDFLDTSFPRSSAIPLDMPRYHTALSEANETIRLLYHKLCDSNSSYDLPDKPPIVDVDDFARDESKEYSEFDRAVNARMLNGENFVTDWDDLVPDLPPPPEHELRSPIVQGLLMEWTSDAVLHESLLAWIEDVLAGADLNSVHPLIVSNLGHEVRDGFVMHVLPVLLKRSDIRVVVKTRVKRETTYDLSVSVNRIGPPSALHIRRHFENTSAKSDVGGGSVTHSAATAMVSNGIVTRIPKAVSSGSGLDSSRNTSSGFRILHDEVADDDTAYSPHEHDETPPQPSIMSALGGALGGLLTRRPGKSITPSHATIHDTYGYPTQSPRFGGPSLPAPGFDLDSPAGNLDSPVPEADEEDEDDDQPYHRVLSAPPGRIGVTFVEFRGHAMVSEVASDSPLRGWIFASDILIAIDDVPVSGMRVRDIIQLLKDRAEQQQRALRVISSHAMHEFTMPNVSVINE